MTTRKNRDEIIVDIRRSLGPAIVWRMKPDLQVRPAERDAMLETAAFVVFEAIKGYLEITDRDEDQEESAQGGSPE